MQYLRIFSAKKYDFFCTNWKFFVILQSYRAQVRLYDNFNAYMIIEDRIIAIVGLGFLCLKGDLSIEIGDIYLFIGALFFTFQIIAIDYFSQKVNLITMSMIQMGFASIVSFIFMMILIV